ncbi:Reverse transcriptase domain, partial [Trinorchestia longiramus]
TSDQASSDCPSCDVRERLVGALVMIFKFEEIIQVRYRDVRDTAMCGIPRCTGYRDVRDTATCRIPRRAGYRDVQDTATCRITRCAGYRDISTRWDQRLHAAASRGDVQEIRRVLDSGRVHVDCTDRKIYSDIDTKNVTLLLLLDLSKAFGSVEHTQLLQKISNLGIATQWFQSYLANRSHAVRLENTISSPIQNDFDVPQGSILGPLLFSIFINDFPSMSSNTRISMYADDVQIAMTSALAKLSQTKSNAEILLKHVKSWYDQKVSNLPQARHSASFLVPRTQ